MLAVSTEMGLEVNYLAVPRKAKEPVGTDPIYDITRRFYFY